MIEINNLVKFPVDKKSFSQVAKIVLKGENRETENISLAFVNKEEIKKLNKKFRKENKATDVLSFNLGEKDYLGEIIICPDVVKENAQKYKVSAKEETMKVFVHGILHLLGYDHQDSKEGADEMEEKQNLYLSKFFKLNV
jgi:probable rRNA maturation factor